MLGSHLTHAGQLGNRSLEMGAIIKTDLSTAAQDFHESHIDRGGLCYKYA